MQIFLLQGYWWPRRDWVQCASPMGAWWFPHSFWWSSSSASSSVSSDSSSVVSGRSKISRTENPDSAFDILSGWGWIKTEDASDRHIWSRLRSQMLSISLVHIRWECWACRADLWSQVLEDLLRSSASITGASRMDEWDEVTRLKGGRDSHPFTYQKSPWHKWKLLVIIIFFSFWIKADTWLETSWTVCDEMGLFENGQVAKLWKPPGSIFCLEL